MKTSKQNNEEVLLAVGTKVSKISGKPFQSGSKVNTIKGVTHHPVFPDKPAYSFEEDDSIVEAWRCRPLTADALA